MHRVVKGYGDPCHGCGQPTQIREHEEITQELMNQHVYYMYWFVCCNPSCSYAKKAIKPKKYAIYKNWESKRIVEKTIKNNKKTIKKSKFKYSDPNIKKFRGLKGGTYGLASKCKTYTKEEIKEYEIKYLKG